jgi:hypothetical protein
MGVRQAKRAGLVSAEHFTVDGTLIEAWASLKSFRKKGEKPEDRPPPDDRALYGLSGVGRLRGSPLSTTRHIKHGES